MYFHMHRDRLLGLGWRNSLVLLMTDSTTVAVASTCCGWSQEERVGKWGGVKRGGVEEVGGVKREGERGAEAALVTMTKQLWFM